MQHGILIVDDLLPDPKRDAGSVGILSHIRAIKKLGFTPFFLSTSESATNSKNAEYIKILGCMPLGSATWTFEEVINFASLNFAYIYVLRRIMHGE